MGEKLGIDALKNVIGSGFHFTERVFAVTSVEGAGGAKVTIPELIGSAGIVYDMVKAVLQAKQAYAEVQDLDETEKKEMHNWAKTEFDIPNDKVEAIVVQSIVVLLEIATAVELIEDLKAA